jgi:antitoxin VapB
MALNIKNADVERLAAEVAGLANESKTEAIRRALADRKQRLLVRRVKASPQDRLQALFRDRIWPQIPPSVRGRRISRKEREKILGYGPAGV